MTPPTIVIGAATSSVQVISTSICTCCTSLVMRVISDGAPKLADLAGREVGHLVEQVAAHVAAEAHRRRVTPKYTAPMAKHDLHERDDEHQRADRARCRRCRR